MPTQSELIVRLVVAAALGSVIGFERERLSWAAGLRTHMLVCVGSALIMIVSAFGFNDVVHAPNVVLDPSRMAAQVVSGIGFLGAGSILLRGKVIRGLTTAASLWSVAGIGLAVGGGLYTASVAATTIILIILAGLKPLERWYFVSRHRRELRLIVDRGAVTVHTLEQVLGTRSDRISKFVVQQSEDLEDAEDVLIALARVSDRELKTICTQLLKTQGIRRLEGVGTNL